MREMLLSFKPSVYKKIVDGIKIFEHRRNFPNEPILAYMYVSKPVRAITGIVILERKHLLSDWKKEFSYDSDAVSRISEYEKSYRFAMEINEFKETNAIGLDELKEKLNFVAPQSYIYLDTHPDLEKYIHDRIVPNGKVVNHTFEHITSDQVCVH